MKEEIRKRLLAAGAVKAGFARAGEISDGARKEFEKWIGEGMNGEMTYLHRHIPLRQYTDSVLKDSKTVISLAFDYTPEEWRTTTLPVVAAYAYKDDYHITLRELLNPVIKDFQTQYGGKWRLCIDSAPVAERYWAMKSGIGIRGVNGNIIIDGVGSYCFLSEILTSIELPPDSPSEEWCDECGACVKACPNNALRGDGTMDSRRCINYLTIEKKGEFSDEEIRMLNTSPGHLYGCDRCQRICPHNKTAGLNHSNVLPKNIPILKLLPENILLMEESEFNANFSRSPILYAGYSRLLRNAKALQNKDKRYQKDKKAQ